jgi:RHS repeat-associated protein
MMRRLLLVFGLVIALPCGARAQTTPPTIEHYHLDAIGSIRAVTNDAGQVIRRHHYAPFGKEHLAQGGNDPLRFTGKERDGETGLDYFGARYYASRTGRFTSVDPVMALNRNFSDPQSWNRYNYTKNNPVRCIGCCN